MKTSTVVFLSAAIWGGVSIWLDSPIIGAVLIVGHILFWRTHVLEVKINRLLDERGIFVANYELNK